jgi:hypothetical protein
MSTIINATTTTGVVIQPDNSGSLVLQTNSGTTALTIDTSQRAAFVAGTAALPAITTTGDTNTGIFFPAADTVATSVAGTESMRIKSNSVGIGSTLTTSGLTVGHVGDNGWNINTISTTTAGVGAIIFTNPNGVVGSINTSGSSTGYSTSSDYRLKENIAPMVNALATVQTLKPVTYKWKVDGSDGQGFIAHELAEVVPDCVSGEKDAVNKDGSIKAQGVDTSFLVATLTAAIQEQQTLITSLTARITALEAK